LGDTDTGGYKDRQHGDLIRLLKKLGGYTDTGGYIGRQHGDLISLITKIGEGGYRHRWIQRQTAW
jgi:hypothetical protein